MSPIRSANTSAIGLYGSIKALQATLSRISDILNKQNFIDPGLFIDSSGPLRQSELELKRLQEKLGTPSHGSRLGRRLESLKWPFKAGDVEKTVVQLEKHKRGLILQLGVEAM